MLTSADAMGKIQQYYMDGSRPVPYLTFMHIYNDLLEDSAKGIPKAPSDELREKFRAVCMAINVGVLDTEGRADDRVREFKDKVLPVWRQKLPPDEIAKYEQILQGGLRAQHRAKERAQAPTVAESAGSKTSDLLRRLGITPTAGSAGDAASGDTTAVLPAAAPASAKADREAPTEVTEGGSFETVDELNAALQGDELPLSWGPRKEEKVFARYMLGRTAVVLRLVEGDTRNYLIATAKGGYQGISQSQGYVDDVAGAMGYAATAPYYYRHSEGQFLMRVRMWPDYTDVACGCPKPGDKTSLAQQVQKIHRDLGELLERLGR